MSHLDFGVSLAYILCIVSALLCLVYGVLNWNKGKESESTEILEEMEWEKKENEINESL